MFSTSEEALVAMELVAKSLKHFRISRRPLLCSSNFALFCCCHVARKPHDRNRRLGNRNRRPRAARSGRLYIGSRGALNPVVASIRRLTYILIRGVYGI